MTASDPTRQWCVDATELLRNMTVRAARLAAAVAIDWLDPDGQAWAERINALHRDLDEAAHEADELVGQRPDTDPGPPEPASALAAALAAASGVYGPRLGDTSGARVGNGYGMRIAQLPDA
jgi:hypothetical protein